MWTAHTLKAFQDNFIFVLEGPDRQCAAVDPGDSAPVFSFLAERKLSLTHILCTHHHADHIGGVAELKAAFGCAVFASDFDQKRIDPSAEVVGESKPLKLWGKTVAVLDVPGHTLGHIAYYFTAEKAVFVGDTLFSAGCGRLFEGTAEQMFASLQKLKALPLDTQIFCAHEYTLRNLEFVLAKVPSPEAAQYRAECERKLASGQNTIPSSLAQELKINPFLTATSVREFANLRRARNAW